MKELFAWAPHTDNWYVTQPITDELFTEMMAMFKDALTKAGFEVKHPNNNEHKLDARLDGSFIGGLELKRSFFSRGVYIEFSRAHLFDGIVDNYYENGKRFEDTILQVLNAHCNQDTKGYRKHIAGGNIQVMVWAHMDYSQDGEDTATIKRPYHWVYSVRIYNDEKRSWGNPEVELRIPTKEEAIKLAYAELRKWNATMQEEIVQILNEN
jgi:hypothetical protein